MNPEGFAFKQGEQDREELVVINYCLSNNIPYKFYTHGAEVPSSYIPVGSVKFCEQVLGKTVKPNYYPEFLKDYLFRKVWLTNTWPQEKDVFVKPADAYKRFTGFLTYGGYAKKKKGPFWCSEKIKFIKEWRFYVSKGIILAAGGYVGTSDKEIPEISLKFPQSWSGAADFGLTEEGKFVLIEAQHPYAIGWYGSSDNNLQYIHFIVEGWQYMKDLIK